MLEILLGAFKYAGMVLTGVFGVYGLMVKFKDDDDKITNAGKTALFLIVVSTFIAISSQTLELITTSNEHEKAAVERANAAKKQGEETLAAVHRTETTISEIRRGLYPLKDVRLAYSISVPTDHIRVKDYVARFQNELLKVLPILNKEQRLAGIVGGALDAGRNYTAFSFDKSSTLAPIRNEEKLAYAILAYAEVELQFYLHQFDPKNHPDIGGDLTNRPDLKLSVTSGLDPSGVSGAHSVDYAISSKQFQLQAFSVKSDPAYWESNGSIVGIPDLQGCQMFIRLPSSIVSGDDAIDKYIPEIRKRFALESLTISVAGGQEFWFRRDSLTRHTDMRGFPLYEIKLDDLKKFRR